MVMMMLVTTLDGDDGDTDDEEEEEKCMSMRHWSCSGCLMLLMVLSATAWPASMPLWRDEKAPLISLPLASRASSTCAMRPRSMFSRSTDSLRRCKRGKEGMGEKRMGRRA